MYESLVGIIVPNAVTATRESTIEQSPIQNIFCKCPENFLRDILQHQEFFLHYGKIFPTKNTPTRYSLMKNVFKISHNLNISSIAPRNNKIKRRELRVRQNIVKGHSKQAFCVLIIITCNYLIMVVFSSEFFLLIVVSAYQIQRDLNT